MSDGAKCPKCGNHTLEFGYGLCGGGIGAYSFCTTDGCEYFDKTPDPELSTPDEIAAHQEAIDRARSAK